MPRTSRAALPKSGRRPYDQARDAGRNDPPARSLRSGYDQAAEERTYAADGAGARRPYDQMAAGSATRRPFYDQADERAATRRTTNDNDDFFDIQRRAARSDAVPTEKDGITQTQFALPLAAKRNQPEQTAASKNAAGQGKPRSASGTNNKNTARKKRPPAKGQPVRRTARPATEDDEYAPPVRRVGTSARQRRRRRHRTLAASMLLVLAVGLWLLVVFVFKISDVTVDGQSVYNDSVILEQFGHQPGDNLFSFSASAAAQQMQAALPYLETVRITRRLPGSVVIHLTGSAETYCFAQSGSSFVITSSTRKVLRIGDNTAGLLVVRGVVFDTPVAGQPLSVQDEAQAQALDALLAALEEGVLHNCTEVDVSDVYGITLRCEGRFILQLGTTVGLDYKLQLAAQTIYNQLEPDATGVIDLSSATTSHAAYYTPGQLD